MQAPLLFFYAIFLIIRPQDWWGPVYGWQLINYTIIGTIVLCLPLILARFQWTWREALPLQAMFWFLVGAMLSGARGLRFEGFQLAFEQVGRLFLVFAAVLILARDRRSYQALLFAVLVSTAWLAWHTILQHHTGVGFGGKYPLWRLTDSATGAGLYQAIGFGTFEDPNDLCLMLIIPIPIFYAIARRSPNLMVKLFGAAGAIALGYAAWATNSRGGVVAALGMAAAWAIARVKGWRRYVLGAISIAFVTVIAPSRFGGGMASGRAVLWGDGIAMFKLWPIYGCGYSRFMQHSSEWQVAHNSYIHVLGELGLIGYVPFFFICYLTVVYLLRLRRQEQKLPRSERIMLAGLQSMLIGFMVGCYFLSRQYHQLYFVIYALVLLYVLIVCDEYKLYSYVVRPFRAEFSSGLKWCLGSIPFMWITVRIANMMQ